MGGHSPVEIIDIRDSKDTYGSTPYLRSGIIQGLSKPAGSRTLPPELLYDEVGLKIYNEALNDWSKWYYPVLAEKELVKTHGAGIAEQLKWSKGGQAVLVELGAGSLEKTTHVLLSLASLLEDASPIPPITYYALDLDKAELERTLASLQEKIGDKLLGKIATKGMWGTYDDGIRIIRNNELGYDADIPIHLLFLGGTIGNFHRGDDVKFLKSLPLRHDQGDVLIMGIDKAKSVEAIEFAYGFEAATPWIMNGLRSAGIALCGQPNFFPLENWERFRKYNEELGRYEVGYQARKKISLRLPTTDSTEVVFEKGEIILIMISNKYTDDEIASLLKGAGLGQACRWIHAKHQYCLLCLSPVTSY